MQQLMTFMAAIAGLVFSVAVALAIEELIFGKVFQLFFTAAPVRSGLNRNLLRTK